MPDETLLQRGARRRLLGPSPPAAVLDAVRQIDGDPRGLVRLGLGTSNGVWRLDEPFVVLTAYGPHHDRSVLSSRLRVAAQLADRVPFVRLSSAGVLRAGPQGQAVAVWERLVLRDDVWAPEQVGAAVARLASIPLDQVDGGAGLPVLSDVDALLQVVAGLRAQGRLGVGDAAVLQRVARRLESELDEWPADPVLVHGDLHRPNVLWTDAGVVLCDLDELGQGHPWWDLAFVLDPGRGPGLDARSRSALLAGWGGPAPDPAAVRTMCRLSHLRRTVRELQHGTGLEARAWNRLRVSAWAATERDWSLDLHPVFCLSRARQAALLATHGKVRPGA